MELTKLTLGELKRLKSRVETEIGRRSNNTRRDLLKKIHKMTAEAGLSISEILGKVAPSKTTRAKRGAKKATTGSKGKVAPKYRNPQDTSMTWTGRGRKPQWVTKALAAGKKIEELLIK
jgi:DNA-binding protein H-NS